MIERHITFTVRTERTLDFEQFFAGRYRPTMSTSPGFVRAELLREADEEARYQMTLRFVDADAAAGWRTSEAHEALQPALTEMVLGSEIVAYEVVA